MGFVYNKVDSVDYSDLGITLSDPATQLRSGVKALNSSGVLVTGAMPEHGSESNLIIPPNTSDYSQDVAVDIPSGYYDGNAKATAEYNTVYTQGLNIGLSQNAYKEGVTLTNPQTLKSGVYARDTNGTLIRGTRKSSWTDQWVSVEHSQTAGSRNISFRKDLYENSTPLFRIGVNYWNGSFPSSDKIVYYTFIGPSTSSEVISLIVADSSFACYRLVQFIKVDTSPSDTDVRFVFMQGDAIVLKLKGSEATKNQYALIHSFGYLFS